MNSYHAICGNYIYIVSVNIRLRINPLGTKCLYEHKDVIRNVTG